MSEHAAEASTLADFLRVVRRRKWIIVQAAVIVPIIALLLSSRQPDLFQSSAQVLLSRQNQATALAGATDVFALQDPVRYSATQAFLARSPVVAERVVAAAKVPDRTAAQFYGASSVSASDTADVLTFSVVDVDGAIAATLVNEYAKQFVQYRRELDTQAINRARDQIATRLADLRREGKSDSDLYWTLEGRSDELSTIEALQRSNTFVARPAGGAAKIQPRPRRDAILGFGLGIVFGIGLAFLREALDSRLRSAEEIAARIGLPLLGRIAEPPRRLRTDNELVMLAEPNGPGAEMFRMLRTSFELTNLERGARVVMVTSALEDEGKSTTVANLALALALSGKRVVLVDLDLRRPAINRLFRIGGQPGLTDVAVGDAALADVLVPIRFDLQAASEHWNGGSFDVLPSGPTPPDPGEFVATHALTRIIDALRERADYVLLDTPPLLQVGDAMVLTTRVDGILLVTRLNRARRATMTEVKRLLDSAPAAKIGFIVTGAEAEAGYEAVGYAGKPYAEAPKSDVTA